MRRILILVALSLLAAGCQPKADKAADVNAGAAPAADAGSPATGAQQVPASAVEGDAPPPAVAPPATPGAPPPTK